MNTELMNILLLDMFIRIGVIFHLSQIETALMTFLYGQSKMYTYSSLITDAPNEDKATSRHFLFGDRLGRPDFVHFLVSL